MEPTTSTSTFTQTRSSEFWCSILPYVHRDRKDYSGRVLGFERPVSRTGSPQKEKEEEEKEGNGDGDEDVDDGGESTTCCHKRRSPTTAQLLT